MLLWWYKIDFYMINKIIFFGGGEFFYIYIKFNRWYLREKLNEDLHPEYGLFEVQDGSKIRA